MIQMDFKSFIVFIVVALIFFYLVSYILKFLH